MNTAPRLAGLFAAFVLSLLALAAHAQRAPGDEPTLAQIYQAANSGQLERADAMVDQVLKSHPNSARAHYVKAELAARGHKFDVAKQELGAAERIAPGLPFAKPESLQALRNQISGTRTGSNPTPASPPTAQMGFGSGNAPVQRGLPWGTIALVGLVAVVAIAFMRRRCAPPAGDGYGGAYESTSAAPYGQTGYGPVYPPNAGNVPPAPSMGSSIMRGLGAGLAVGAGAVAAEEIGHRMFPRDGRAAAGSSVNENPPTLDAIDEGMRRNLNTDMGGDNFGIADGGWDDGGGTGGGDVGGGDWDT
jgi:uncharacterized protein